MPRRLPSVFAALLLLVAAPALLPGSARAQSLTVEGNIVAGPCTLTREELDKLPRGEFTTTTQWTQGKATFRGVMGQALMRSLGAAGTMVEAHALDGYTIEIPLDDFETTPMLIADQMDGKPLPKDKGPFWIVYPYDAGYDAQQYVDRSVWALDKLVVK
ncbi:hypothetical protein SAMN06265365_105138 [Tistlia consotensis]|uniref:Oxidoreductase molybdopterin-binding domain-containing protein n=1 Tax=Tistlia consotensis USBA 355 TaxID=560819 RepID=A0A1Y6BQQ1_9PROT|nr:molybdopterin-dependent oxidoreductase [Tistlia consotensis]SMF13406.1 hypothetical protein SAMN05428998_105160 [Tistlia consotensis USBA 355]SNR50515.1 hypothetical protein SAMN06265365_105138 [Tistlia consotensis]